MQIKKKKKKQVITLFISPKSWLVFHLNWSESMATVETNDAASELRSQFLQVLRSRRPSEGLLFFFFFKMKIDWSFGE